MTTRRAKKGDKKASNADRRAAEIDEFRARAAELGLRLAGETLDARLPQARCTAAEKKRAEELAAAAGISLSEHIRRRAVTSDE